MKIAITGASGLVGTALVVAARSCRATTSIRLVRGPRRPGREPLGHRRRHDRHGSARGCRSDRPPRRREHRPTLDRRDASGACSSLASKARALIAATAARLPGKPVLVCASAIGYYGDRGDEDRRRELGARARVSGRRRRRVGSCSRARARRRPSDRPSPAGDRPLEARRGARSACSHRSSSAREAGSAAAGSGGAGSPSTTRSPPTCSPSRSPSTGPVNVTAPGTVTNLELHEGARPGPSPPDVVPAAGLRREGRVRPDGRGDAARRAARAPVEAPRRRVHASGSRTSTPGSSALSPTDRAAREGDRPAAARGTLATMSEQHDVIVVGGGHGRPRVRTDARGERSSAARARAGATRSAAGCGRMSSTGSCSTTGSRCLPLAYPEVQRDARSSIGSTSERSNAVRSSGPRAASGGSPIPGTPLSAASARSPGASSGSATARPSLRLLRGSDDETTAAEALRSAGVSRATVETLLRSLPARHLPRGEHDDVEPLPRFRPADLRRRTRGAPARRDGRHRDAAR